jgi:hypothetical protein
MNISSPSKKSPFAGERVAILILLTLIFQAWISAVQIEFHQIFRGLA